MNLKILLLLITLHFFAICLLPVQSNEVLQDGNYCHCQCLFDCSCLLQTGVVKLTCEDENGETYDPPSITSLHISNIPEQESFILQPSTINFTDMTDLNFIGFTNSTIKSIQLNAFKNIPYLTFLNLSGNHLTELPSNIFEKNKHLSVLDVSNNPLIIPQNNSPFLIAPSVKRLILSYCGLKNLPATTFMHLNYTEELHLSSNYLTSVDNTTFMYLELLQELQLSENQIKSIPSNTFIHNPELAELYINKNPIITLKNVEIPNLNKLEMKYCKVSEIDQNTFNGLTDLVELNLKGNVITQIHVMAFSNLKELMYIDLSDNKLSAPLHSKTFLFNPKLEALKLSNNPNMKSLPQEGFYGQFSELYRLDLADCGISDLNKFSFMSFTQLKTLNMSGNFLENIRRGTLPKSVITLDLSRNRISDLAHLNIPYDSEIRRLILRENPLQKLNPVVLSNIQHLTKLDVSSCKIKTLWGDHIPEQLFPRLESLYLQNNNIQSLSPGELDMIGILFELNIKNNPLKCDKTFNSLMKWLTEKEIVASNIIPDDGIAGGTPNMDAEDISDDIDGQPADKLGWKKFATQICSLRYITDNKSKTQNYSHPTIHTIYDATKVSHVEESNTLAASNINSIFPRGTTAEKSKLNKWLIPLIILICIGGCALFLTALVFYLRWSRQQSIYNRNRIIKRTISNSKLRKNDSSYKPLQEDLTAPTTPMVTQRGLIASKDCYNKFETHIGSEKGPYRSTTFQPSMSVIDVKS